MSADREELIAVLRATINRLKKEGNPQSLALAVVALVTGIDKAAKDGGHWEADMWHLASQYPDRWGPAHILGNLESPGELIGGEYENLISAIKTANSDEELNEALQRAAERDWKAAARICEVAWPDEWGPGSRGEVDPVPPLLKGHKQSPRQLNGIEKHRLT